jgi:hypothetical protein
MAHHHHAPHHPHSEGKEPRDFNIHLVAAGKPELERSSHAVEAPRENARSHEKRKSIRDYQIAGFPWSFVLVVSVIMLGVLLMVLKVVGAM